MDSLSYAGNEHVRAARPYVFTRTGIRGVAPLLAKEGLGEVKAFGLTPMYPPLARGDAKHVRAADMPPSRTFRVAAYHYITKRIAVSRGRVPLMLILSPPTCFARRECRPPIGVCGQCSCGLGRW